MSPISKFLRILRIERGENAKQMSDRLNISPSYLSAIENGKRSIPARFQSTLISAYELNAEKQREFKKAVEQSSNTIKIDFSESLNSAKTAKVKQIIFSLVKDDVSDKLVNEIFNLISKD